MKIKMRRLLKVNLSHYATSLKFVDSILDEVIGLFGLI
jgi:hypothetical protein